jgi:hypothetical protein
MDPDKALETALLHAAELIDRDTHDDQVLELAEAVLALDEWLRKGGFLPKRWKEPHECAVRRALHAVADGPPVWAEEVNEYTECADEIECGGEPE